MRCISALAFLSLLLQSASCSNDQEIVEHNPFIIDEGTAPWIIAHGGSKALWPENTLLAFRNSVLLGIDALEMDIRSSKDNYLMLHHDENVDRMSDTTGAVASFTRDELLLINAGANFQDLNGDYPYKDSLIPIPTLESLMLEFSNMPMIIEIKDEGDRGKRAADSLKAMIDRFGMKDRTIVASFHDDIIEYYLSVSGSGYMVSTGQAAAKKLVLTAKSHTGFAHKPDAVAAQLPMKSSGLNLNTSRVVNSCHRHNMAIHYWTINEKDDMENLIEVGADGIITDRPDLLIEVLKEKNLR